jgi:preprotein translocase subunit SecD
MHKGFNSAIAVLLLVSAGTACSFLRPKSPPGWHVLLEIDASVSDRETATKRTVSVIEQRLDTAAVQNFKVVAQGNPANGRIRVSLPDVPDRKRLIELITTVGQLELTSIVSPPFPAPVQTYNTEEEALASLGRRTLDDRGVLPYAEGNDSATTEHTSTDSRQAKKWVVIEKPAIVDGRDLRNAAARTTGEGYQVAFALRPEGAEKLGAWTGTHISDYLGVVLNGEVKSIAFIKSQINDQGEITGRFTKQAAEDLALVLRSGALPAPVKIVEQGNNE